MSDQQVYEASRAEIAKGARAHYEEASSAIHHWSSTIPKAIDLWEANAQHDELLAMLQQREAKIACLQQDIDLIKQRNEALQAELDEQCKLHSLGAEREYILLGKIARLECVALLAREVYQHNSNNLRPGGRLDSCVFELGEALDRLGGSK